MVENEQQHQMFQKGLESLGDYCNEVQRYISKYDPREIITIAESFGDTFVNHLHEEIPTLAPEKLRVIFPEQRDIEKTFSHMMKWIISSATKIKGLPFVSQTISHPNS